MVEKDQINEQKRLIGKQLKGVLKINKKRRDAVFNETKIGVTYQSEIISGKRNYTINKLIAMVISAGGTINISVDYGNKK